jgi:hypothetical protein
LENHPGEIYLSQDESLGIFATHEFHMAAKDIIDKVLAGASIAGPQPDRDVLRNLSKIVGKPTAQQDENGPPIVLSHVEALHFEAIMAQFYLRDYLPDRIKRVCPVDGTMAIEDPVYLAQRAEHIQREYDRNIFINNMTARQRIDSGHPVEGLFRLFLAPQKPSLDPVCPGCGSTEYDRFRVTFCPECKNRREEFLLVECPDCDHDFVASVREHIWTTGAKALQAFNVSYKYSAVINAVRDLDGYARDQQINHLLGQITADTGIFHVARCRLIDNRRRDTLLLLTTEGISWSSKRYGFFTEDGSLQWAQVASVSESSNGGDDFGLALPGGRTITFSSFTGNEKVLSIGIPDDLDL